MSLLERMISDAIAIETWLRSRVTAYGGDPDAAMRRSRELVRAGGLRPREAAARVIREMCNREEST